MPASFESIHQLNNYPYDPTAPTTKDQLPAVPFLNIALMIASRVQPVDFQNGSGVPMPDLNSANPDMESYYASIQQVLNSFSNVDFTPSLDQLDAIMQSLQVAP